MSAAAAASREHERAIEIARAHPARAKLAGLCFELLSRQAEGRTLLSGKKLVAGRAKERDLATSEADTDAGNVVRILSRGPDTPLEHALVAAFAVCGLGESAGDLDEEARGELLARFVRHLEWLETSTDYRLAPLLEPLLSSSLAEALYDHVARAVERDDADGPSGPALRARQAARLSLLADASFEGARVALRRVLDAVDDPLTRAAAAAALGVSTPPPRPAPSVCGRPGRVPAVRPLAVLRWLSGWALLCWLGRVLGQLVGLRRSSVLELGEGVLTLRHTTTLLGREVRRSEQLLPLDKLEDASRRVRYPALPMLLGVVCFAVGLLIGGWMLADGLRAGYGPLIGLAALVLLLGAGLDLGLDVLTAGRRGQVILELHMGRQRLSLSGVPLQDADALLAELARRLG